MITTTITVTIVKRIIAVITVIITYLMIVKPMFTVILIMVMTLVLKNSSCSFTIKLFFSHFSPFLFPARANSKQKQRAQKSRLQH